MPFEILTRTEATLTTFTGRVETHGKAKVPAASIRLRFSGPNTLIDLLSPTARKTFYMAEPGQEDLPGVEPTTPLLRSKDIKHWSPETAYEGWTVTFDRTGNEEDDIELGGSKIDGFTCDLFENPARVEIECRVGTHHLTADEAGFLWSKQQQKVFVMLAAPLTTQTNPDAGVVRDPNQMTLDGDGNELHEPSAARQAAEDAFGANPGAEGMDPSAMRAFPGAVDGDDDEQDAGEHVADDVERNGVGNSANPKPRKPRAKLVKLTAPAARYRDPDSGQTWTGRGLKPKWLAVALERGKALSDFEVKGH